MLRYGLLHEIHITKIPSLNTYSAQLRPFSFSTENYSQVVCFFQQIL